MNGQKPDTPRSNVLLSGDKYDTLNYTPDDLKQAIAESVSTTQEDAPDDQVKTRSVDSPADSATVCRWGTILPDNQQYVLFQIQDRPEPISVVLKHGAVTLGRSNPKTDEHPDVDLGTYDGFERGVSRKHVRLFIEDGMLKVRDLNSTNGTYLNGTQLAPYQSRILRHGDELRLGKLVLHVMMP